MINLIDVQCPHCGANGQIMFPPIGAIIIGPCPQCNEYVVIFCGQCLAVDKKILNSGQRKAIEEHLFMVLSDFIRDRVEDITNDIVGSENSASSEQNDSTNLPSKRKTAITESD